MSATRRSQRLATGRGRLRRGRARRRARGGRQMLEQPWAHASPVRSPVDAGAPAAAPRIARLAEDRVEEAGELLARAFLDDPFSSYVVPDPDERPDSLPFLYEVGVRYGT